jgi:hypothetical protein
VFVVGFNRLQFTGRETHAGVWSKTYRVIRRRRCAAQWRVVGQRPFEQLAEAIQIGFGHPPLQRLEQTAGFQPGIR